jgi:hypothetical protein
VLSQCYLRDILQHTQYRTTAVCNLRQACENALRDFNKVFGEGYMHAGMGVWEITDTESPARTCQYRVSESLERKYPIRHPFTTSPSLLPFLILCALSDPPLADYVPLSVTLSHLPRRSSVDHVLRPPLPSYILFIGISSLWPFFRIMAATNQSNDSRTHFSHTATHHFSGLWQPVGMVERALRPVGGLGFRV